MDEKLDMRRLKKTVILRLSLVYLIMGSVFFMTAGTFRYWEGWVYMTAIGIPMTLFVASMFKQDPKFLERRMKTKEKRPQQKRIVKIGGLPYLLAFILPGLDRRFGWSDVSVPLTMAGLILTLLGYLSTLHVFRTNSYASRVVEIENEQKVITTVPYARTRHPMYASVIVFYLCTPLALGSWWSVIPSLFIIPLLIARILDEEKELEDHLEGYREYMQKVRYRLIPGIW